MYWRGGASLARETSECSDNLRCSWRPEVLSDSRSARAFAFCSLLAAKSFLSGGGGYSQTDEMSLHLLHVGRSLEHRNYFSKEESQVSKVVFKAPEVCNLRDFDPNAKGTGVAAYLLFAQRLQAVTGEYSAA